MSKDRYFEMCEMMGTEPIEEEIPIEFEDLPSEVQETMHVYSMLQDNFDTMNGVYIGKNYSGVFDVFNIMEIEDHRTCFSILNMLDRHRGSLINKKTKPAE